MNANRMLGVTTTQAGKSTEKLSSGYRINRAADDAAGLAISEKMRKQIRGLDQASQNSEDGISCVQTAEGALAEVQDMLQRMNELCVQAANGTNSKSDRQYIQDEIDQLVSEIDRVAETTKFNETYLLKGDENKVKKNVYITNYSTTFTPNDVNNADENKIALDNKVNYIGNNNIIMVDKGILTANSNTKMASNVIRKCDDITPFMEKASKIIDKFDVQYLKDESISFATTTGGQAVTNWYKAGETTPTSLSDIISNLTFDGTDILAGGVTYYKVPESNPGDQATDGALVLNDCFDFKSNRIYSDADVADGHIINEVDMINYFEKDGKVKQEFYYVDDNGDVQTVTANTSLADLATTFPDISKYIKITPEGSIKVMYSSDETSKIVASADAVPHVDWYAKGSSVPATDEQIAKDLVWDEARSSVTFKAGVIYYTDPASAAPFGNQQNKVAGTEPNNYFKNQTNRFYDANGNIVQESDLEATGSNAYFNEDGSRTTKPLYKVTSDGRMELVGDEQVNNYVNVYIPGDKVPNADVADNRVGADLSDNYVAFMISELNANIDTGSDGLISGRVGYDLSTNGLDDKVRANQDLFIFDTKNDTVFHLEAGVEMADYINDDNTMNERYRLIDILDSNVETDYFKTGTSDRIKKQVLGGNNFKWGDNYIEAAKSMQKLYNSNGQEISGVALNKYFDENGNYMGGLYTTDQARAIDEVFANDESDAFMNISSILGHPATTIDQYISQAAYLTSSGLDFQLQAGADADRENKVHISIDTLTATGLGIDKLASWNIGIVDETGNNATDAIDVVAEALQKVSRQRSNLGAIQNRLEHTIKNLDNVVENTTAAESQIRDTDMAEEMVRHSNINILQQAGQSMLAQANQSNQGVLSLLQG